MKTLNIKAIRIDGGTQSRVEINNEVVSDYAEAIKVGIEFPPVVVFGDGADYWLADGFHRYHAHNQAGKASIAADVRAGTQRDAILFSAGANGAHGLRRTNADKRKAVELLLNDTEWAKWSDRRIAEMVGVTHPFVANIRTPKVVTVTTPAPKTDSSKPAKKGGGAASDSTKATSKPPSSKPSKPATKSKPETPSDEPHPAVAELAKATDSALALLEDNERLSDRLAVEAMDTTEEEKLLASALIAELRAQIKTLSAELKAVKNSRDRFQDENAQLKRQCAMQRKQLGLK